MLTGIAMVGHDPHRAGSGTKTEVRVNTSIITFRPLTDEECERYWDTGEPAGKAGGYAIQGLAGAFIKKIEGSYSSVMGLPLCEFAELLAAFNIPWFARNE